MARKVVVPDDGSTGVKSKKKRSKCCTCCLAILLVGIVLLAAAFCAGWFLGDKYLKQYFGVTMKETWGVVTGLYGKSDKHVVTNPYNDSDLDAFYSEIKTNILLKSDADIDFDAALETAIDQYLGVTSDGVEQAKSVGAYNAASGEDGEQKGELMDVFVNMIADVFTRENIDVERLKAYSEENDNYVFNLRDKQLAAFVSSVLDLVLGKSGSVDMLSSFSDKLDLKKVVKLKQIRFAATSIANELGEQSVAATTADVTVWIGLQAAAGQFLRGQLNDAGVGWAGGVAAWLGNVILPKNLYATVTIPLYGEADAHITLNNMSTAKRDTTYKLINGALSMGGGDAKTIQEILGEFADKIKPYLETAADKIDFGDASDGTIGIDLIGTMADMASKNLDSSDPLTKSDFMYLLQALLTSDADARKLQLRPYLYEGWYRSESSPSELAYDPADKTGMVAVDYKDELRDEIENKYCLDVTDPVTGEKLPLDELFKIFGISFNGGGSSGSSDPDKMLDWVKPGGLKSKLDPSIEIDDIRLNITDRMLGALLSDQMSSILPSGSSFDGADVVLDALTFTKRATRTGHMYATLAVELELAGMLDMGGNNMLSKLASNVLPENILLTVEVDVTGSTPDTTLAAGDKRDPVSFMFNDYSNTDNIIDTLGKLVPDLDLNDLTEKIEKSLVDMLDELNGMLEVSLVASDPTAETVKSGVVVMPDIFTVIADLVLVEKENGEPIVDPVTGKKKTVVTAEQLKEVLSGLEDNEVEAGEGIAADYSAFQHELGEKYYLNTDGQNIDKFSDLTEYIDGDFDESKFNITGDDTSKVYLAYDARSNTALHPILTGGELGLIITENMGDNIKDFAVESVETFGSDDGGGESGMIVTLSIDIGDLLPAEVKALLSADTLYITARVVTSEVVGEGTEADPKRHPITFDINNMTGDVRENTLKIVKFFMPDFDLDAKLNEFGTILYDQLNSLTCSLGGSEENSFITFTDDGVRLKSFYEFLSTKLNMPDANPDLVKAAVQGMYTKSELTEFANANNYVASDIVTNRTPIEDKDVFDAGEFTAVTNGGVPHAPAVGDKGKAYTDTQFNDYLDGIVSNMAYPNPSGASAVQTVILKAGDTSDRARAMRRWLNDGKLENSPIKTDKDYLVITFEMLMDSYASTDRDNASVQTLLPHSVFATIVMEKTGDGTHTVFELVDGDGLVFNDMRYDAYEVLFRLMGMEADADSDDTVNIATVTKKAKTVINGFCEYGRIDFEQSSANGVGEMQFTYYGSATANVAMLSSLKQDAYINRY